MTHAIGIGFSQNLDIQEAAKEAAFQSKSDLGADKIHLSLIFSTIHYPSNEILPVIHQLLREEKSLGCSTAGIIHTTGSFKRGILVLTMHSTEIKCGMGAVEHLRHTDALQSGASLAQQTIKDLGHVARHALLFFMDDKMLRTSPLLKGLQQNFGNIFPVIGAGSSDDFHFQDSFQTFNQMPLTNSIVGLLIGGNTSVGIGVRHGWRPLGKPRFISSVDGPVIKEIDRKPAFHIYEEYFGDEARIIRQHRLGHMALLYPLGIHVEGSPEFLLRNAIEILEDLSIVCQGDLPQGSQVHLMLGNKESAKAAAREAALEAQENLLGKKPKFILIMESLSRLKLLGRDASSEIQVVRNVFGLDVPIAGMYSNGEVSPFQTVERFKKSYHLNESIVVIAIT